MLLDPARIRASFPALSRTLDGRPVVFADAPGGTQVPERVIEAMSAYLRASNANTHGAFVTSRETDDVILSAHRAAADLLGCDPDEAVFGPNATSLLFHLSRSLVRTWRPEDEIVVTRLDHDANIRPWVRGAEDTGARVRWVDICERDVTLDLDSFDASLSERTKLVAITLASNAVGTAVDVAELARRVHDRTPALIAVDAVHAAQHRPLDVRALGADLLVCSPYKFFGPHLGLLFGRRELLTDLVPYKVRPASDATPYRWETGTQNHEAMAGFVAAVDHIASLGPDEASRRDAVTMAMRDAIGPHEAELSRRFLEGLAALPHVRLYGISDPERVGERTPTFAIRIGEGHPQDTATILGERGIFVWDGNYYAVELMERLGLEASGGAVRIGFCHYNTAEEVGRVLEALAALA